MGMLKLDMSEPSFSTYNYKLASYYKKLVHCRIVLCNCTGNISAFSKYTNA